MASTRREREEIARERLTRILGQHVIANARTLEQKISDAGPKDQRIDPHILTSVRNELIRTGNLVRVYHHNAPWYHLPDAPAEAISTRLGVQLPTYQAITNGSLVMRLGQTLEIATYRALCEAPDIEFYGRFKDLEAHDDSTTYSKEEPPQHIGKLSINGNGRLDFIVRHKSAGPLGLECKNIREWLYPDRPEVKETLQKCVALDCVPVIIARRIPYVTHMLLSTCGVVMHQNYNQLLPLSDAELAAKAKHKDSLAYHDIREGNQPNDRLIKFIGKNLDVASPEARQKFDAYKDLLAPFASGDMSYKQFAARVRRRTQGANEDHDWEDEQE